MVIYLQAYTALIFATGVSLRKRREAIMQATEGSDDIHDVYSVLPYRSSLDELRHNIKKRQATSSE